MVALNEIDDAVAAKAFRRLVLHLRQRSDAQNIDMMGLAGFCRNCLADWIAEASEETPHSIDWDDAREAIYGMPYAEWKKRFAPAATPEQAERMKASIAKNRVDDELDEALDKSFPASDPPSMIAPGRG